MNENEKRTMNANADPQWAAGIKRPTGPQGPLALGPGPRIRSTNRLFLQTYMFPGQKVRFCKLIQSFTVYAKQCFLQTFVFPQASNPKFFGILVRVPLLGRLVPRELPGWKFAASTNIFFLQAYLCSSGETYDLRRTLFAS